MKPGPCGPGLKAHLNFGDPACLHQSNKSVANCPIPWWIIRRARTSPDDGRPRHPDASVLGHAVVRLARGNEVKRGIEPTEYHKKRRRIDGNVAIHPSTHPSPFPAIIYADSWWIDCQDLTVTCANKLRRSWSRKSNACDADSLEDTFLCLSCLLLSFPSLACSADSDLAILQGSGLRAPRVRRQ